MKKSLTIVYLIFALLAVKVNAQTWSGTIVYGKNSFGYLIKLGETEGQTTASFSSIEMNAYEIPCQNTTLNKDSLHFYVVSDYYTYEYQYIKQEERFRGDLKVYSNETEELLNSFETDLIRENIAESDMVEKQEFSFRSNNLILYGTLWKPKNPINKGLFFVTSSQGNDRSANNSEAKYFADLGFTVFNYDKRGTGKSEGDWKSATIEELSSDDMNAVRFFSKISTLPLSDIGIKGSSQGGVKIPYILSEMPQLGFGISISCPSGTLLESDLNRWKNLNSNHFGDTQIHQALKIQKAGFDFLAGNISYKSLLEAKDTNNNPDWLKYIWIPEQDVHKDYKLNFSGLPYFQKITQPLLVIQGLSDDVIPADSYRKIENALKKSNSKNYEVVTFENTNHSMSFVDDEFPFFQLVSPEYLPYLTDWLKTLTNK
ncbi:alpha/beta hydrolase family protein [Algoriphagus chordae]|nr:alpha/beta fold hydrolase [Algoriphagus chordae]